MNIVHPRRLVVFSALTALAVVVAACGASAATHGVAGARASSAGAALVKLRSTSLGKVLVDRRGRTLYLFEQDKGTRSTCTGSCAAAWPPLLTKGKPRAGAGVKQPLLRTSKRSDGRLQVTYKGHPLYFYAADTKAGQVNGEDVGGVWYAVSAAGTKVAPTSHSSSTPAPTTTTPGYGYGGGGY
jgi:predicted lipoprotein with Yx(FWY)xxD motif